MAARSPAQFEKRLQRSNSMTPFGRLTPNGSSGTERIKERILYHSIPEPNSGCWLWLGRIKSNGYGTIGIKKDDEWRTAHAHRISYEIFVGRIPDGLDLDHKCRQRCCINPDHLEPVTRSENLKRSPFMGRDRQRQKTHCPRGHPYSGKNNRGERICHVCARESTRLSRERKMR